MRRLRRRSARWWLSLVLAAAAGAAAASASDGHDPGAPSRPPRPRVAPGPQVPDGRAALALARDERSLPLAPGDLVDLLATDLATGRATVVARRALVIEVSDDVATVAVARADLAAAAGAANQGLLVPALVPG